MAALVRLLAALAFAHGAAAETLTDPTAPPAGYGAAAAPAAEASAALRLQMIVRGPGETRTAVIDGRSVRVGDAIGGARVLRISDRAVVLDRGGARQTLELLPGTDASVRVHRRHQD
jgi:MSHA biogenesis protein MshK